MKMRKFLLTGVFSLLTFSVAAQSISGPGIAIPVPITQGGTGATTASGARTNLAVLGIAANLSDVASASTSRTNLGLGTMATQNSNAVAITGGTGTGLTSWSSGTLTGTTSVTTPTVTTSSGSLTLAAAAAVIVNSHSAAPTYNWFISGAAADAKNWDFVAAGSILALQSLNDARNSSNTVFQVNRGSGFTLTSFAITPLTIFGSQIQVTGMTQTSAAQSGTMCYNVGTGAVTYDATLGCLASLPELKDIAGFISPEEALAGVMKMKPIWASFKQGFDGDSKKNGNQDIAPMFNARELEGIDKRLVGYGADGKLRGARYAESIAYLTAAIQAQQAQIVALSSR